MAKAGRREVQLVQRSSAAPERICSRRQAVFTRHLSNVNNARVPLHHTACNLATTSTVLFLNEDPRTKARSFALPSYWACLICLLIVWEPRIVA